MSLFSKNWGPIFIGLTMLFLMITGNRGLLRLYQLQQEKQNLTDQIHHLQEDITRYQDEVTAVNKNPAILEKQAREELNLVRPGEIIYKFSKNRNP